MVEPEKSLGPVVAFHLHASHLDYDPRRAANAFELIRSLEGNGVRFELSWFDIEPKRDAWDRTGMAWYKEFMREAVDSYGITPIVNLAGTPAWAAPLLRGDRSEFIRRWRAYCERAVELMDGQVRFVQVWNEPNNPILQLVERAHAHVGIFNHNFFHEMLHVASDILRTAIRPLEILINVTSDLPNWESFLTGCIRRANDAFDIIGLDFYRGAYLPGIWNELGDLERLLERVNDPHDLWFGKQAALAEFGFSTFMPPLRGEETQREWANSFLREVRRRNKTLQERQAKSLRLISWYQLYDEPRRWPFTFLAHFGIVRLPNGDGHGTRKLAFDTVQQHLRALRRDAA